MDSSVLRRSSRPISPPDWFVVEQAATIIQQQKKKKSAKRARGSRRKTLQKNSTQRKTAKRAVKAAPTEHYTQAWFRRSSGTPAPTDIFCIPRRGNTLLIRKLLVQQMQQDPDLQLGKAFTEKQLEVARQMFYMTPFVLPTGLDAVLKQIKAQNAEEGEDELAVAATELVRRLHAGEPLDLIAEQLVQARNKVQDEEVTQENESAAGSATSEDGTGNPSEVTA